MAPRIVRTAFHRAVWSLLLVALLAACVPATGSPPPEAEPTRPAESVFISREAITRLGLTGRLILLRFVDGSPAVFSLDLASGEFEDLFSPPRGAWITAVSASPAAGKIAMAYAPAPEEGQSQLGFTGISLLPLQGGEAPEEFIPPMAGETLYSFPVWSPDGGEIYYNRFEYDDQATLGYSTEISRRGYPQGAAEPVVELGQWPRLSTDGESMVYIAVSDQAGLPESLRILDVASAGSEPVSVPVGPEVEILDFPLFSTDGRMVYFSAPTPLEAEEGGQSFWDRWLGAGAAQAHSVPSEWWRVPVEGGRAERLTDIAETGLNGAFAPDGTKFAFIGSRGVHVMNPDGSDVVTLIEADGFFGTMDWVP